MTGRVLFFVLAALVLLLLATVSTPVVLGSEPALPALSLPVPVPAVEASADDPHAPLELPDADHEVRSPTGEPVPSEQSSSICDEIHWLVSMRNHNSACANCAACRRFDVYRSNWQASVTPSSEEEMVASLIPGIPVCIVVHGSFVPPDEVPQDSRNTVEWLRTAAPHLPVQLLFVTWSSEGIFTLDPAVATTSAVPGLDVAILGRRAEMNGVRLARLVRMLPQESPVCLIGHSHGARMVSSALNLLGGGHLDGHRIPAGPLPRVRAILVAAAIDHDWIVPGQRYERALCATESLLSLRSEEDWALWFYPLRRPFSRQSLGRVGFSRDDLRRMGTLAHKVSEVDVTPIVGIGHIWPRFYERPVIAQTLVPWVYFAE